VLPPTPAPDRESASWAEIGAERSTGGTQTRGPDKSGPTNIRTTGTSKKGAKPTAFVARTEIPQISLREDDGSDGSYQVWSRRGIQSLPYRAGGSAWHKRSPCRQSGFCGRLERSRNPYITAKWPEKRARRSFRRSGVEDIIVSLGRMRSRQVSMRPQEESDKIRTKSHRCSLPVSLSSFHTRRFPPS